MHQLADGVWQLSGLPRNAINVYLLGDVVIDSGLILDRQRVLGQLKGRSLSAHAITHAHLDHYGSSRALCERFDLPMWCGAGDVEMVETGKMLGPGGRALPAAPSCRVERGLRGGDEVAGFKVIDTPGHSPGHVSYWREADRVLICGDVIWGMNPFLNGGPPREPFPIFSPDASLNRESARTLAALEPELVCFGHGAPLRDPGRFAEIVAALPRS